MLSLSNRSFWLSAAAVAIVGCSGDPSSRFSNDPKVDASVGSGSGGAGGGGLPPPPPPGTGGSFTVPLPAVDYADSGAAHDDDPTNPGITHPRAGRARAPTSPRRPSSARGFPTTRQRCSETRPNTVPATLCVLEPQLSADKAPGRDDPRPTGFARASSSRGGARISSRSASIRRPKSTTWSPTPRRQPGICPRKSGREAQPTRGSTLRARDGRSPTTAPERLYGDDSRHQLGLARDARRHQRRFQVAPVVATGSMVFWTVNSAPGDTRIEQVAGLRRGRRRGGARH